jgi:glyoxylase-like metal-dependent hydrolase (beta-lactamase superfamily II)
MKVIEQHGLHLVGAIITHYHFDHVGGIPPPPFDQLPIRVSGIATLLKKYPHIVGYMHSYDVPFLAQSNPGLPLARIHVTKDNFELKLSERIRLKFIHTPGHTPGSQCILVNNMRIFTGDTLFLGCCGRLDLEGGSERRMFETLNRLRTEMADEVVVYPGHAYGGGEWTTIGEEKLSGALREMTREEWVAKMEAHDEGGSSKRQSLNL